MDAYNKLKTLNAFQQQFHEPKELNEEIKSNYFKENKKTTWTFRTSEKVKYNVKDDHIEYISNSNVHGLLYSELYQTLPEIKCKDGYKAHWIKNPMANIIKTASLYFDNTLLQSIDSDYLNVNSDSTDEEWLSYLPKRTYSIKLPWFYSNKNSSYFPFYKCGLNSNLIHKIEFKDIKDILLIGKVNKDEITLVDFPEGIEDINFKEVPQLWDEYLFLSPIELKYNYCYNFNFNYIDIYKISSKKKYTYNQEISVPINISQPICGLAWNVKNIEYNEDEISPIKESSLEYDNTFIFKDLPEFITSKIHPTSGYNYWMLSDINSSNPSSIVIPNGKLHIKLIDKNEKDYFNVHLFCFILKKFIFDTNITSEEDRINTKSKIHIE
jgi:hypothetical protein